MATNSISENENILVRVDQQNIVHIDPNSILTSDGEIKSRLVDHESLVTYVNLEADLVPRSILFADKAENSLLSLASGTFNMMRNQGDKNPFENNLDSNWTETFNPALTKKNDDGTTEFLTPPNYDPSAQTFGIQSIQIVVKGASGIPQVSINFLDVRGKTLFESPENSPYKAFFHQPWPVFYLTVKGYFGKAIRYRLHLVDFKTKFNGSTGNFEITTKFVGSTYAYLSDILLQNALNAPYMYMVEKPGDYKTNDKTGFVEKRVSKSTKGYSILSSVYDEYKAKGYVSKDFPVKTLRDLIMTANSLDKIIENALFAEVVDASVLSDVAEYDSILDGFEKSVVAWGGRYLSGTVLDRVNDWDHFGLTKTVTDKTSTTNGANSGDIITGTTNNLALQRKITYYVDRLEKNSAFGKIVKESADKNKVKDKNRVTTFSIDLSRVSRASDFTVFRNGNFGVAIERLVSEIKNIQNAFVKGRDAVEMKVESRMNEIIKDPKKGGFGFAPTIRNIFAVILANTDTYIRLMKDVHQKAIRLSNTRKEDLGLKISDDKNECLYPWPEVKKKEKDRNTYTHFYPGDKDIAASIKGDQFSVWPEVEFVETYHSMATKRVDPLSNKEISSSELTFVFDDDVERKQTENVSTLFNVIGKTPYSNKTLTGVLYEIYERAQHITSMDSFGMNNGLREIVKKEFENINNALADDVDLRDILSKQIKSSSSLEYYMRISSPNDRYPYFIDKLATVDYIKETLDIDFDITDYNNVSYTYKLDTNYEELQSFINDYKVETYRFNIFPFNTEKYKTYVGGKPITNKDYNFKKTLFVGKDGNFISSPIDPLAWVEKDYRKNMFTKELKISGVTRNILNTPYFHKQLFSDFFKGGAVERYTGSAYLLLNSLPFKDLDDKITFNELENNESVLMSTLFREVGSTHYIPYHLLLKWGSIYHRYKKFILDGVDIISGITAPINTKFFFDNNTNTTLNLSGVTSALSGVTMSTNKYAGLYPYYHGVYHQIVNGYSFFNPSGFTTTTADANLSSALYVATTTNGVNTIKYKKPSIGNEALLTSIIDNSIFTTGDDRYTILPSNGGTPQIAIGTGRFYDVEQDSFRLILGSSVEYLTTPIFSGMTFPTYYEKLEDETGLFSLNGNKKKVIDLIATFNPTLLDEFEKMFIKFASLDFGIGDKIGTTHDYDMFQEILKEISSIPKDGITLSSDGYSKQLYTAQVKKLELITDKLLENKNLKQVTLGNPKQVDNNLLYKLIERSRPKKFSNALYTGLTKQYVELLENASNFREPQFNTSQLTAQNYNYMLLYIGENIYEPQYYSGITHLYANFFQVNDIKVDEQNIHDYRELARIYAGWVKSENVKTPNAFVPTNEKFIDYLTANIFNPNDSRLRIFLDSLIGKFPALGDEKKANSVTIYNSYNEAKTLKLDTYQFFKSFNDKWIAGNAIGQRSLIEEFLFLDRANRDIGDEAFINLERLISLSDEKNAKVDLYSAISILIQGTNFDMRPLPAYVNFYGTNTSNKKRIIPSKNLARNLFGTYLEVDYQESSPKIILQHIGNTSKYLDMARISKEYKFKNDSFDISDTNNNPLLVEPKIFMDADISKSNRVVSFEINFGDQGQGLFKSISLDQATYKNTTESAVAQERLARSQSGGGTTQVDIGLFDIYKTASYQCEVTMMGDVMIQPTMYFYLSNVPMFHGTYYIMEVNHSIKGNSVETSFKGVRISNSSLPKMSDSFVASYRPLFSRILSAALRKKQQQANEIKSEKNFDFKNKGGNVTIDIGSQLLNEDIEKKLVKESGYYLNLIPYNGAKLTDAYGKAVEEKYVQLIDRGNNDKWLRARVVLMGGNIYKLEDTDKMLGISYLTSSPNLVKTWGDIKTTLYEFCTVRLNTTGKEKEALNTKTIKFSNPKTGTNYELASNIDPTNGKYDGIVHSAPKFDLGNYGIAMNSRLMKKLKLNEGDLVYFQMN
jgi:hypothetical protein